MQGENLKAVIMAVAYGIAAQGSTWAAGNAVDPTAVSVLGVHYMLDDESSLVSLQSCP